MKMGMLKLGSLMALTFASGNAMADCVVELQLNGRLLGGATNIFRAYECRDALRSCMQKKMQLERNNPNLNNLTCQTVSNGGPSYPPAPNPYPPTPNPYPPSNDMSRYELILEIERLENSQNDVEQVVDFITNMSFTGSGTKRELARVYATLLSMHGGNTNTASAMSDMRKLEQKAKRNYLPLTVQLQRYQAAKAIENTLDDAHTVMDRVEDADLKFQRGFDYTLEVYADILRFAGGNSNTADALSILNKILTRGTSAHVTYDLYKQFRAVENTIDDAFSAIDLIYQAQSRGIPLNEARYELERLIRQYGNSNTADAHRRFRYIYNF